MCKKDCSKSSCPFAKTEESEMIQAYGCLPTSYDILVMRVGHGKTWACHSDPSKPCVGAIKELKRLNLDSKILDKTLINEQTVRDVDIFASETVKNVIKNAQRLSIEREYDI